MNDGICLKYREPCNTQIGKNDAFILCMIGLVIFATFKRQFISGTRSRALNFRMSSYLPINE